MNDDFDLSDIASGSEERATERARQQEQQRLAEQAEREASLKREEERCAKEKQEAIDRERSLALQKKAAIAAMPPFRRFLHMRRRSIVVTAIGVGLATIAGGSILFATYMENARIAEITASCDTARLPEAPTEQLPLMAQSWITCPSEDAQLWALNWGKDNQEAWDSASFLRAGATSRYESIRASVAGFEGVPSEVQDGLAEDSSELVRLEVAKNPQTASTVLASLAQDRSPEVRVAVVSNTATNESTIFSLVNDESSEVVGAILNRPKNPEGTILALAQRNTTEACRTLVRDFSTFRIQFPDSQIGMQIFDALVKCQDWTVRAELTKFLSVASDSATLLLATDVRSDVRRRVANSSDVSSEILSRLALDQDETVRREVAANRNTPVEALIGLAQDESESVRRLVSRNEGFSE